MVELLGEQPIGIDEYVELLENGLSESKVGLIPPGIDTLIVGDMQMTRLNHIKVLFFLGVNDGLIPKTSTGGGLISDMERKLFASNQIVLAATERER